MSPFLKPLLVLSLLLALPNFSPFPSEGVKCFSCTHETYRCQFDLNISFGPGTFLGQDLITECPDGGVDPATGDHNPPHGCIMYMIGYEYPLEVFLYRGCEYIISLGCFMGYGKAQDVVDCANSHISETKLPELQFSRHLREDVGVGVYDISDTAFEPRKAEIPFNGLDFKDIYNRQPFRNIQKEILHWRDTWTSYTNRIRDLRCYVCTDVTSRRCDGALYPGRAPEELIKVCPSAGIHALPIGCMTMVFQFEYPVSAYVYRDCLYTDYFTCFDLGIPGQEGSLNMTADSRVWNPFQRQSKIVTLHQFINCINWVRQDRGLPGQLSYDELPSPGGFVIALQRLHFVEKHSSVDPTSWDLSNGESVSSFIRTTQSRVPEAAEYECYTCDTRNPYKRCDGNKYFVVENIPRKKCGKGAYGCAVLYEEDGEKTVWFRRECWYKGDLTCLKGRRKPSALARAIKLRGATSPESSKKRKCNARQLLEEGRWLVWDGERAFQDEQDFQLYLECRRTAKQWAGLDQAEWDTFPKANEISGGDSKNKVIRYYYCSKGKNDTTPCNEQMSRFYWNSPYVEPPPTTTATPLSPPSPTIAPPVVDPPTPTTSTGVRPWEEDKDDNECECVDCHKDSTGGGDHLGGDAGGPWLLLGIILLWALL